MRTKDTTTSVDENLAYKVIHLGVPCDLLGSAMSVSAERGTKMEPSKFGVILTSGKTGAKILLPWNNIKAIKLG